MAVDAIRGEKTLAELAKLHDVHPNQITDWRNELLECAASVFRAGAASEPTVDAARDPTGSLIGEPELPTASVVRYVASGARPSAAVDNSVPMSNPQGSTYPSQFAVQTSGATARGPESRAP